MKRLAVVLSLLLAVNAAAAPPPELITKMSNCAFLLRDKQAQLMDLRLFMEEFYPDKTTWHWAEWDELARIEQLLKQNQGALRRAIRMMNPAPAQSEIIGTDIEDTGAPNLQNLIDALWFDLL